MVPVYVNGGRLSRRAKYVGLEQGRTLPLDVSLSAAAPVLPRSNIVYGIPVPARFLHFHYSPAGQPVVVQRFSADPKTRAPNGALVPPLKRDVSAPIVHTKAACRSTCSAATLP